MTTLDAGKLQKDLRELDYGATQVAADRIDALDAEVAQLRAAADSLPDPPPEGMASTTVHHLPVGSKAWAVMTAHAKCELCGKGRRRAVVKRFTIMAVALKIDQKGGRVEGGYWDKGLLRATKDVRPTEALAQAEADRRNERAEHE